MQQMYKADNIFTTKKMAGPELMVKMKIEENICLYIWKWIAYSNDEAQYVFSWRT